MEPGPDERLAGRGLALGDLVLVVREDEVDAAGVDVERRAEVGHAHRRALDVPARLDPSPIAGRPDRLTRLRPLPQGEVADVVLAVLVGLDPLADAQRLRIEPGQPPVRRPRGDAEEDRAVVGAVGVAALEQGRDERDDLVDVGGRPRQDVGAGHPRALGVGQERGQVAVGQVADAIPCRRRAADDLVVDVGDVHHPADRVARASAGGGRAGRRTGTTGSCRCGPARRPSGRTSTRRPRRRGAARTAGSRRSACRAGGRSISAASIDREGQRATSSARRPRTRRGCRSTP